MNTWLGKTLLLVLGIVFMLKGGINIFFGFWRIMLPLALLGGGYFLAKNYFVKRKQDEIAKKGTEQKTAFSTKEKAVIEICPHCLQEIGSCPKCKKSKRSAKV